MSGVVVQGNSILGPSECVVEGCSRQRQFWRLASDLCFVHWVLKAARWRSEEDLVELRDGLAKVKVASAEERQQREARSALRLVRDDAKRNARNLEWAREAGATDEQIAEARATGEAEATS